MPEKREQKKDQIVELRGFYLRLLSRWFILPAAALIGALIGFVCYTAVHVWFAPARDYAAGARLYLEFAPDAAGNARDLYNAWTWKDLITGDEILDRAMASLIEQGFSDERERTSAVLTSDGTSVQKENDELVLVPGEGSMPGLTRADVLTAVTIRMPSDLRVMMLTATRGDAASADAILNAMAGALTDYGDSNETFDSIRVLETTPALPVVTTDLTKNAVILGAVLALLIAVFALFLFYASDDAVYDPEMAMRRFELPPTGVLLSRDAKSAGERAWQERLAKELAAGLAALPRKEAPIAVVAPGAAADTRKSIAEALQQAAEGRSCTVSEDTASIANGEGAVIMAVPYGRRTSAVIDHERAQLKRAAIPVEGVLLYDADIRYLARLYGVAGAKE